MLIESKINVYSGIRFYTKDRTEVTELIKDGKTKAFKADEYNLAKAHAEDKRSYIYNLQYSESKEKHRKRKFYGYAVPN